MGKLMKLCILLTVVILFAVLLFASDGIGSTSSNIKAFFFSVKNTISRDENGNKTSQQPFGRGFSASSSQKLGDVADPNYIITFPKDHYSHDSFDIEWWYLTANLQDIAGNDYALQWTLFRFRNPNANYNEQEGPKHSFDDNEINVLDKSNTQKSQWSNEHIYMAHASVHSPSKHWFSEKFARGNVGNAGTQQTPFKLFIDDWQWQSPTRGLLPAKLTFNTKLISESVNEDSVNDDSVNEESKDIDNATYLNVQLNLSQTGPYILQGQSGYSIKSANGKHASHYYSAPFIEVEGTFTISKTLIHSNLNELGKQADNSNEDEIAIKGNAWFDQEWTSQLLDQATLGWDWLSLHLDNGDKIMAFQMRLQGQPDYITGTYIDANGSSTTLMPSDIELNAIELTSVGNKNLPLHWELIINSKSVKISIKATKNDQWNPALIAYYEGAVAVSGTHNGKGFLELTGY